MRVLVLVSMYTHTPIGVYSSLEKAREMNPELTQWTDTVAWTERSAEYGIPSARLLWKEVDV